MSHTKVTSHIYHVSYLGKTLSHFYQTNICVLKWKMNVKKIFIDKRLLKIEGWDWSQNHVITENKKEKKSLKYVLHLMHGSTNKYICSLTKLVLDSTSIQLSIFQSFFFDLQYQFLDVCQIHLWGLSKEVMRWILFLKNVQNDNPDWK